MGITLITAAQQGAFDNVEACLAASPETFRVVRHVSSVRRAVDAVRRTRPQVLLLELQRPFDTTLDIVRTLRGERLAATVVMCERSDAGWAVEALRVGAAAYLFADMDEVDVDRILRMVARRARRVARVKSVPAPTAKVLALDAYRNKLRAGVRAPSSGGVEAVRPSPIPIAAHARAPMNPNKPGEP